MNNIIFKYYFKDYKKCPGPVRKCSISYLKLISMLELYNTKDSKGYLYNKGYTYQLQQIQNTLLKTKDLNIFKCNVYVDDQIIL